MRRTARVVVLLALTLSLVEAARSQQTMRMSPPPKRLTWPNCEQAATETASIADFDRLVRKRFLSYDDFGMRRIMRPYQHADEQPVFRPETDDEYDLACAFRARGADLAILIAGRGILGYEPAMPPSVSAFVPLGTDGTPLPTALELGHEATLSDPVRVTGDYANGELPDREQLVGVAKAAFRDGSATLERGGWTITASAIPAVDEACVQCHNGENGRGVPQPVRFPKAPKLRTGDPIGVALYVSRTRR